MEIGTVRQVDIDQEMQVAYLDYAMSVIVARALPDVRDGLKPVHRRILYAMHDMNLHHNAPYKKSARIVGEVLGKYHPHGDAAVYESMVRMAQDFSMRYVLVDGQGNFGSIDGDSAAAMRYTEARQAPLSEEMLRDIEKNTVDFGPNFDGSLQEPLVLPSAFPNLLVNGSSGIAVGMATNIPPHNLSEVCDAIAYLIDHYHRLDDIGVDELMQFIKGPDFPTGGIIHLEGEESDNGSGVEDSLRAAYAVGRGRITVQAKAHIEEMSRNRNRIVVTELPYQVNKSRLIERIAELVREGRLEGITDLRDESDRQGMRIIIELTRNVEPKQMLRELFRLTPMRSTFSIMLLALVDGEPRMLSLRRLLFHYVEHRREVIVRRSQYDLQRARERAHILQGLLIALDNLDEVIQIIRHSRTADTAHASLRKRFKLTDVQAQAILDMPLRRLAALERQKIEIEYKEKLELIAYLEDLLAHPAKILALIKQDMLTLKEKYGDPRRTQIVRGAPGELVTEALLPDENHLFVFRSDGLVRRESAHIRRPLSPPDEIPRHIVLANTRDTMLCFTADGRVLPFAAHQVPSPDSGEKKSIKDLLNVGRIDDVTCVAALPFPADEEGQNEPAGAGAGDNRPQYLMTVTLLGKIKRTPLAEVRKAVARGETQVMNVDEHDRLMWALLTPGSREVILVSAQAKAIRFGEEEIRPSGLGAGGVMAMKLEGDDRLVGCGLVRDALLITFSQKGYGKASELSAYPAQKRYGAGVVAGSLTSRTGPLIAAAVVTGDEEVIAVTTGKTAKRLKASDFPVMGRASGGRNVALAPAGQTFEYIVFGISPQGRTGEDQGEAVEGVRASEPAPEDKAATAQREDRTPQPPKPAPARKAPVGGKADGKLAAEARTLRGPTKQPAIPPPAHDKGIAKAATATPVSKAAGKATARGAPVERPAPAKTAARQHSPTAEVELDLPVAKRRVTKKAAEKQPPTAEVELDLPVLKRGAAKKAAEETKSATAKKVPGKSSKDGEAVIELPVKKRPARGQLPLPLEDKELDLPAPVKKPRRSARPDPASGSQARSPARARGGGQAITTDGSGPPAKDKTPPGKGRSKSE